jgi:hypothetical protein
MQPTERILTMARRIKTEFLLQKKGAASLQRPNCNSNDRFRRSQ